MSKFENNPSNVLVKGNLFKGSLIVHDPVNYVLYKAELTEKPSELIGDINSETFSLKYKGV